jgi:hypothetical protein
VLLLQTAEAPSWTDKGAFWVALFALAASAASTIYARSQTQSGRRSADAAEKSEGHARESTTVAKQAAASAEAAAHAAGVSADADGKLAQLELDREHDACTPRFEGRWELVPSRLGNASRHLLYRFRLDREYAIKAIAWQMNRAGQTDCSVTPPTAPGGEWMVSVEHWSHDRDHPANWTLELKFWPPQAMDGRAVPWVCRCGRSAFADEPPHWDVELRVEPPPGNTVEGKLMA